MGASCNLCNGTSIRALFVKNGFVLGQCEHCGLVYVQNPPSREELRRLYSFATGYHAGFKDREDDCRRYIDEGRRHYEVIRGYKSQGRLLDVGCSAGFFLKVARDHDWDTYGLELSKDTAAIAEKRYGLQVVVGILQESTFPKNSFDVVTLWDALEHLDNPKETLFIVNQILKDDGIVVISTPNIDGLFPRLSYRLANLINYWPHPEPPRHLFQFSKTTLERLLGLTGFALVEMHDERIPLSYTFGGPKTLLRSPARLCYSMLFVAAAIAGPMLGAGDNVVAVAKKSLPQTAPPVRLRSSKMQREDKLNEDCDP